MRGYKRRAGNRRPKKRKLWLLIKAMMDKGIAAILLVVLGPVMLLLAAFIWLCDGRPVFFTQNRLGLGGKLFRMYKFRTMRRGSDQNYILNEDGSLKTEAQDDRITSFGRLLRRYSLDELPQLLNVLKGDMSLVGPRPDLPFHYDLYTLESREKLLVKPGITGLAQVAGRNALSWSDRLRLDVEYVEHMSLTLDIRILILSVWKVITGEGVYAECNDEDAY